MSISYRKGVVDQTTTKKTKMQSLQMRMLDSFGKKYGLNITFVNTLGDFNGFYKPGTNQIVVGLDASEGAVTRTVGHEVYHYIKDANKEGAQKIEDFVLKSLKKLKGEEWVQNKLDSYDKSVYKTEQEKIDELVADCMFDVFTNEKTVQEFVKQDRSLAQRVLDRVKTLIADIRNIYNKLIARGSDEIAALRNELETLEKIRDLFFEALDETAPAVSQKQKNTAEAVSKVLLSIKNFTLTESDINKNMLLVGSMENVAELTGNEFKKSSIELPDQVDAFFKKFNYSIENPDIGDVEVTRRGAKDSIGHGIGRIKAVSFAAVPYTIEKGKIVDYQNNWKNRQYDTIVLAAPISINGERYYQGVIVMRETSTQRFYLHEVLTEKESDTSFKTGAGAKHTPGDVSPSLISLLQKVKDVNNNSMQKGSENTPVKFSKKLKPNLDPDGVRTPGKRLVESDLTKEGGLNYNFEEHDPLSFDDRAMPNSKSSINWVYKAEIFSNVENKMFHQKLAEIRSGRHSFKQLDDGTYIIPIENKLVFTNGDFNRPYVREIIEVITGYSTNFEKVKDVIVDEARGRTGHREAMQLVKQVFGDGLVLQYKSDINGAYGWADRKPKGRNRRAAINNYINQQIRKRNASKSGTNQSVIPSAKPTNPIREEVSDYINNRSDMQAIYKTIDKRYRLAGKKKLNEKSI